MVEGKTGLGKMISFSAFNFWSFRPWWTFSLFLGIHPHDLMSLGGIEVERGSFETGRWEENWMMTGDVFSLAPVEGVGQAPTN
jgi:hypothetical protein